jgi:hypothetical protein
MKLKGSAWPLGLALVWNWSLQSMILVWYWSMILIWYWSDIDLVSIWYWSGIGLVLILVLVWYWSWYWSDIGWILKNGSILRIEKTSFYDWKKSISILLIRIDQDWFFSIPDPQGSSEARVFGASRLRVKLWSFASSELRVFGRIVREPPCRLNEKENSWTSRSPLK